VRWTGCGRAPRGGKSPPRRRTSAPFCIATGRRINNAVNPALSAFRHASDHVARPADRRPLRKFGDFGGARVRPCLSMRSSPSRCSPSRRSHRPCSATGTRVEALLFPFRLMGVENLSRISGWQPQDFDHVGPMEVALILLLGFALTRPMAAPPIRVARGAAGRRARRTLCEPDGDAGDRRARRSRASTGRPRRSRCLPPCRPSSGQSRS
jgi:hypothetical protein